MKKSKHLKNIWEMYKTEHQNAPFYKLNTKNFCMAWEGMGWGGMRWGTERRKGKGWDRMVIGRNEMGGMEWERMGWDEEGRDGMRRVGMGWIRLGKRCFYTYGGGGPPTLQQE